MTSFDKKALLKMCEDIHKKCAAEDDGSCYEYCGNCKLHDVYEAIKEMEVDSN